MSKIPFTLASLAGWLVPLLIVGALVALVLFFTVGQYNGLVKLRNRFRNAFAQIDVQLKRRHDLIPNLVETAKTYLAHEKDTLEAVRRSRPVREFPPRMRAEWKS
jgi:LemA protein